MKRVMLTAVLALGSLSAVAAHAAMPAQTTQQADGNVHHHRTHDPHRQAMHMGKKLGLSGEQTSRLEPILAQRREQAAAIRQNTSLSPEQRHAQLRALHHDTRQQLAGVLTPEQMQQLEAQRKQHHHRSAQTAPTGI